MLEVLSLEPPDAGYIIQTADPSAFIAALERAKIKDPLLAPIIIKLSAEGVIVYHDISKEDIKNEQEIGPPDDSPTHPYL
jgi:hypothetical protein